MNEEQGIWIIDAEGRTSYANGRMAEILGVAVSDMIGALSFMYIFPEDAHAAFSLFESKKQGNSSLFHFKLRRNDGSAVWVDVQGTPMFDPDGVFSGIVGTFSVVG